MPSSTQSQPRTEQRAAFDERTRLALVEQDLDRLDTKVGALFDKLDRMEGKQDRIFVALVVGAIGLVVNVAVMLTIAGILEGVPGGP